MSFTKTMLSISELFN